MKKRAAPKPSGHQSPAANKKSKVSREGHQTPVSSAADRSRTLELVLAAIKAGARCGFEVLAGFNSVMRSLEKDGQVAVVCLSRDVPYNKSLVQAAQARGTAIVVLPAFTEDMGKALGLRRTSCVALLDSAQTAKVLESRLKIANKTDAQGKDPKNLSRQKTVGGSWIEKEINVTTAKTEDDMEVQEDEDEVQVGVNTDSLLASIDALRDHLIDLATHASSSGRTYEA